ncbi:hypothetical protein [Bacillus toyonensis]|uniref:hypothetical protein n=1 Tax=Bacillus toyonensis TaxID=155322 RepID=UPI002E1CAEDD|nr:hypothetical protein [Bacillus toyonensis]
MISLMEELDKRFKRNLKKYKHIVIVKESCVKERWDEFKEKGYPGTILGERYLADFQFRIDFSNYTETKTKVIEEYKGRYNNFFKRVPEVFQTINGLVDKEIQYVETEQSIEAILRLLDRELRDRLELQLAFADLGGKSPEEWLRSYLIDSKSKLIYETNADVIFNKLLSVIIFSFNNAASELQDEFDLNGIPSLFQMSGRIW